jgi:hypothetical protein
LTKALLRWSGNWRSFTIKVSIYYICGGSDTRDVIRWRGRFEIVFAAYNQGNARIGLLRNVGVSGPHIALLQAHDLRTSGEALRVNPVETLAQTARRIGAGLIALGVRGKDCLPLFREDTTPAWSTAADTCRYCSSRDSRRKREKRLGNQSSNPAREKEFAIPQPDGLAKQTERIRTQFS